MTLLVAGGDRVDAGKTTFSTGLVAATGSVGFKPRAGNDCWFDHDDYRRAVERGRLFGKDARRLVAASPGTLEPEEINPVHRLWRPSPGSGTGLLGQEGREFVLDRAGDRYVLNGTIEFPARAREQLPLDDALVVDSLEQLDQATERYHLAALEALAGTIETTDRAVVESYGDVGRPIRGIEPDAVAVVEPSRVSVFDGDRFVKACTIASGSPFQGRLEERVGAVVDLVDPERSVELPALTGDERTDPDAVADAYEPAYEAVLDIAGW